MKKFILSLLVVFLTVNSAFAVLDNYDIVVAGAGTGGISAAIQAARLGVDVLVIEPTDWIGGQATAAGVSTMDDNSNQSSGIYLEFINRIEDYYSSRGKSIATSDWHNHSKAFEPHVGRKILTEMSRGEDAPDFLFNSEIVGVNTEKIISANQNGVNEITRINSIIAKTPEGLMNITCKILIDASEYGDVLALAGAEYRAGNSTSNSLNLDSMIQDITWTAIIRKYPNGIPEHLRPKNPLPNYDQAKWNFENYVTKNGFDFKGVFPVELPVNFVSHNAYRAVPDSFSTGIYDGDVSNWNLISKCGVNWANDYPGQSKWKNKYGLPVEYLENKILRKRIERDALIKTLHFIYYIQNELGESWSIDENEYNYLPEAAKDLPDEWKIIAKHLPPVPYVRESRRIIAEKILTSEELYKNSLGSEISDAIAIGGYILDLHHSDDGNDMEKDLGEKAEFIKSHSPKGNFQVPLSILISKNIDGLIAAEKNLSMSRLVASALRLQPITMMTGQAAGALAGLSVMKEKQPREIRAIEVQKELLDAGVNLSLHNYSDVPEDHEYFKSVQISNLYNLIEPVNYEIFGIDEYVKVNEAYLMLQKFAKIFNFEVESSTNNSSNKIITQKEFAKLVKDLTGFNLTIDSKNDRNLTRGEAANILYLMILNAK